jgi:iron complex transport system permease protein
MSRTSRHRRPQSDRSPALPGRNVLGVALGIALLGAVSLASLRYGAASISWTESWNAVFHYNSQSLADIIVRQLREPRTLIGLEAGASFAVAGALMQGVTRNPLADPGILGINAGAAFTLALGIEVIGVASPDSYVWFAFPGAVTAGLIVYGLASAGRGGMSPVKLTLAGAVLAAFIASFTATLVVLYPTLGAEAEFWTVGTVAGHSLSVFRAVLPFTSVGLLVALGLGSSLNVLSLGEDVARSLGQRVALVRAMVALSVILLAGGAVAAAGPIVFVGLAVPNAVRILTGPDYRWVIPFSAIVGPVFLLGCDIVGRLADRPAEIETGVIVAIIGGPIFLLIARRTRLAIT